MARPRGASRAPQPTVGPPHHLRAGDGALGCRGPGVAVAARGRPLAPRRHHRGRRRLGRPPPREGPHPARVPPADRPRVAAGSHAGVSRAFHRARARQCPLSPSPRHVRGALSRRAGHRRLPAPRRRRALAGPCGQLGHRLHDGRRRRRRAGDAVGVAHGPRAHEVRLAKRLRRPGHRPAERHRTGATDLLRARLRPEPRRLRRGGRVPGGSGRCSTGARLPRRGGAVPPRGGGPRSDRPGGHDDLAGRGRRARRDTRPCRRTRR